MFKLLNTNLYIGAMADLDEINYQDWAVVHATQTVHYKIFNWDRKFNKPNKNHPNYICYEKDNRFSLNWVDGEAHLFNWSGAGTFIKVLDFIDKWIQTKTVLIHCDQGQSRSPTLGLLYLAKRAKLIPCQSFELARTEFVKMYPYYSPSGIGDYVKTKWEDIR
ncbi:MAG: hypothetical protein NTW93_01215 [Phycisphaerae bacterium]|nr:hypothetical protein [Phycisphaerae bacterium]